MGDPGPEGRGAGEELGRIFSSDGGWDIRRCSAHRAWHDQGVASCQWARCAEGGVHMEGRPQPQVCTRGRVCF